MAAWGAAIKVVPVSIAVEGCELPDWKISLGQESKVVTYGDVDVGALDDHTLEWDSPVITLTRGNVDEVDVTSIQGAVGTANPSAQVLTGRT
jgi:hypothetical protein